VQIDPETVETNIVIFEVSDAPLLTERLAPDVDVRAIDPRRVRAVTHLDVDRRQIEMALEAIAAAV
jgi:threonine aldolase